MGLVTSVARAWWRPDAVPAARRLPPQGLPSAGEAAAPKKQKPRPGPTLRLRWRRTIEIGALLAPFPGSGQKKSPGCRWRRGLERKRPAGRHTKARHRVGGGLEAGQGTRVAAGAIHVRTRAHSPEPKSTCLVRCQFSQTALCKAKKV